MALTRVVCLCVLLASLLVPQWAHAEDARTARVAGNADTLVTALYDAVTFAPGSLPDWSYVRSLFLEDSRIVLRVSRDSTQVMTLGEFVDDFKRFIERARADTSGFRERVVRMKSMVMGNIAHVLVLYEASIPGSPRPPQQGVDSFHLVRQHSRWWIVSIVNEVVSRDRPVPSELKP